MRDCLLLGEGRGGERSLDCEGGAVPAALQRVPGAIRDLRVVLSGPALLRTCVSPAHVAREPPRSERSSSSRLRRAVDHARRQAEYRERVRVLAGSDGSGFTQRVVLSTVPTSPVSAEEAAMIAARGSTTRAGSSAWCADGRDL